MDHEVQAEEHFLALQPLDLRRARLLSTNSLSKAEVSKNKIFEPYF